MKKVVKLSEQDLSNIISRIVRENEEKKSLKSLSDEFLEGFILDLSKIMTKKEFKMAERILEKNIDDYGNDLGYVFEKLWREDNGYDIVIQISHNINPTIKNKGSAIFVHCSFEDFRSTAGCIALEKRDLIFLIKNLKSDVFIRIK